MDPFETPMQNLSPQFVQEACIKLAKKLPPSRFESYYGVEARTKRAKLGDNNPLNYLLQLALSPSLNNPRKEDLYSNSEENLHYHSLLETDAHVQRAFQTFASNFPTAIWTCCSRRCFALVAVLSENTALFNAVLSIHNGANAIHEKLEGVDGLVRTRRRSHGRSSIAHGGKASPNTVTRSETDYKRVRRELRVYVAQCLPYLRGECKAPDGTPAPAKPFCIESICQLLGIQRNVLYRKIQGDACIIDNAGVRQRKFRRIGIRKGFVEINELSKFECGCDIPCFSGLDEDALQRLWNGFKAISAELSPEQKEHRYLMNQMFCPLTNTSVMVCNRAISQLYTISEELVASIRLLVHQTCKDPSIVDLPLREHGLKRYRERKHPLNRFPQEIIEQVEKHLDMILRPDPAAVDGTNTCRVYSPDVNTQEKLRKLIASNMKVDFRDVVISPTTLQRMVKSYLDKQGCRISFNQADHNACPMCKSYHCEILFLHYEKKQLSDKLSYYEQLPRPMSKETQARYNEIAMPLQEELTLKTLRDSAAVQELKRHNERDARIRGWLKRLTDHLRSKENSSRQKALKTSGIEPFGWCQRRNFALVTHQDDMTKVDLPHIVVDASADITRWRFDVNAHVNAVTGDCVVFSHEQGAGSKNASSIIETVLLDHIVTCAGENIKVVVSDNASVGKNWLSTVVFPQYLVDQGLADIVLIVFLENNHGKWLADMLFGQFQIRKRNSTILGVDGLLQEFESINRPASGRIRGYAINPLGCIDLAEVFASLGYDTKPPKEFGFKNRNVHFACACLPDARETLSPELKRLLVNALPKDAGMVRLCSEPPNSRPNEWRCFADRWIDVPAASRAIEVTVENTSPNQEAPLVIPLDKEFAAKGPGVVSKRTAEHVGFNGLRFRGKMSFPELEEGRYHCTREAWPPGLLRAGDPGYETESLRCAPENWLIRKPVRHYSDGSRNIKARYPPKNMLNALYVHGPRANHVSADSDELSHWIPTATYAEPPFPIEKRCSAAEALRSLTMTHDDISKPVHLLHVLRAIYEKMGDRESVKDTWLQKPATRATITALSQFKETLSILQKRDGIRPKPGVTLWQAFKEDASVQEKAEDEARLEAERETRTRDEITKDLFEMRMMRTSPERQAHLREDIESYNAAFQSFASGESTKRSVARQLADQQKQLGRRKAKILGKFFESWKLRPGALDRFYRIVEKDKLRHARDLKVYIEEVGHEFDKQHFLLPIQGPLPQQTHSSR